MNAGFFTIITKSYLAEARTLGQSIALYHPESSFYIFLADEPDGFFDPACEQFTIIDLAKLPHQDLVNRMKFYYAPFEFCNAIRPLAHEYILEQTDFKVWMYLDSDILVTNSLEPFIDNIRKFSIVLTPHRLDTVLPNIADPHDMLLLQYGIYNSGMIGLQRTETTELFLDWFRERLYKYCFSNERLMHVDQKWLDLVPGFFNGTCVTKHRGLNVAYWNLHERPLTIGTDGVIMAGSENLLCFHFSGWEVSKPSNLTRYWSWDPGISSSVWQMLAESYARLLIRNGFNDCHEWPYTFDRFISGEQITTGMRRLYYGECMSGQDLGMDPFSQAMRYCDNSADNVMTKYKKRIFRLLSRIGNNNKKDCLV